MGDQHNLKLFWLFSAQSIKTEGKIKYDFVTRVFPRFAGIGCLKLIDSH